MSIDDVQARIAAIQQQFSSLALLPAPSDSTGFAAAMQAASPAVATTAPATAVAETSASAATPPAYTGQDAVTAARQYLGVPYVYGGNDPATGLDCSGLTKLVYSQLGVTLPRVAIDQATMGQPVANIAQAQPGDLIFYGSPIHHVAIYSGDGKMIEAPHTGSTVREVPVYGGITAIRRILPATGTDATFSLSGAASGGLPAGTPYASIFASAASTYGVPAKLLAAVAKVESGFRSDAVSPAGAQGLMQLMPGTARGLGVDPTDPTQAINGAAQILARNLHDFGSVELALAAYNAGAGAVRKYGGIPPYAETQSYIRKVLDAMQGGL